ncbi:hypothetical protein L873DRAFT_1792433 [Choiromyces venosus 120613-1]|uniref:Uncharacterized protein n=1 Tax=Choiromyces venosus 120613-1 TaxID=1336337 RepID=A0A3N4JN02_9PEZI|nr:hypothetical protein L873DRAFT_1792433 [Choiromyces venosus 120613-1]
MWVTRYDARAIEQTCILYPGVEVEKIGHSTGAQKGAIHKIAMIGDLGRSVAELGDCGGCVFVKANEGYQAIEILMGINRKHDPAIVTPLDLILASVPEYEWA